ncbi:MAG: hypothetical protein CM1200mP26_02280 [Acidimicrobiales bacterium]|nr:MAG: hypothetical protein CM1200mP26_02280 [Acidimicrobiales bacterium]
MGSRMKGLISRLPSEYFGDNVFIGASTMSREEVRRRHVNGIDALMWGTDYPHPEGSWPNTRARLKNDFQDATIEDTRRLLGLNAVDCYGLDEVGLQAVADRIGPTPADMGQSPDLRLLPTPPALPVGGWTSTAARCSTPKTGVLRLAPRYRYRDE